MVGGGCGGERRRGKRFNRYGRLLPLNPSKGAKLKVSVPGRWGEMPGGKPFDPYGPLFPFNPYEGANVKDRVSGMGGRDAWRLYLINI
mgnify:CR=1 FL=1